MANSPEISVQLLFYSKPITVLAFMVDGAWKILVTGISERDWKRIDLVVQRAMVKEAIVRAMETEANAR